MPQNPNQVLPALYNGTPKPLAVDATGALLSAEYAGVAKPLLVDANGALIVADNQGSETSVYNITVATVIKATAGVVGKISCIVAGSTTGTLNDCATTGAVATSNEIAIIPLAVTTSPLLYDWTTSTGIVVVPGTGQTLAVTFR